jgi:epoxyqueuosine reductase
MDIRPLTVRKSIRNGGGGLAAGHAGVMTEPVDVAALVRAGCDAGLDRVGVTSAAVLEPARSVLPLRRRAGLAGSMQFTYRNPERSTDPDRFLAGARSLVVGILSYRRAEPPAPGGTRARVARYVRQDHYGALATGLEAMARVLAAAGWRARVIADSNDLVDRNAAWRAGLGWYGKNTNLLMPGAGSWFVLGSVVTDAALSPVDQPVPDGCGPCTACLDGCPTGALVAPGVLDARRCIAWLVQSAEPIPVELRAAVGDRLYGCDTCQEVCPENRRADRTQPALQADDPELTWPDVGWVLEAGDGELLARFGRWYIADRDPDVIRRTALVIIGNVAAPGDPWAASVLARYLAHPNPLLRSHALWAARRLDLAPLTSALARDGDPLVSREWGTPTAPRSALL